MVLFRLLKNSLDDFRLTFSTYLAFEIIYSFLASVLIVPFLTYLFNRIFLLIGKGEALLNSDVYQLGLSFNGLIGMFAISFLAVAVLFLEFGVIIIIGQKNYFKQSVSVTQSFVTALKKLPKLLGFGIFQLFFLLLLGIPLLDASTLPPLLDVNTSILLTELFQESLLAKLIYLAIFIGIMYVYIRWIYALHFIFIENKSISKAMAASWRLTKRNKFRLVLSLVLLNALIAVASFLMVTLISQLATVVESKTFVDFFGNYLQLFSSYIAVAFSLFIIPINMIMLTRLYYEALREEGIPVRDQLPLEESPFFSRIETTIGRLFKQRRNIVVVTIAASLAGIVFINGLVQNSIVYLPWNVSVASHKGDGYNTPENTVASVESAIAKGVAIVEIDVTLTKDDVLVLSHDPDLKRLAGIPKKIRDVTYEELQDIDIGSSFDEAFAGETIPTLDEILKITTETNTGIIIDVKTNTNEDIYAEEIAKLVEKHDAEELASVQSFNPEFLKLMRTQNENINLGQILYMYAGNLSSLDIDFYTVRETMLTERFIEHAKKENRNIWVWTVNSKRNIKKVLAYDIDGIITDYPERVQRIIGIKSEAGGE